MQYTALRGKRFIITVLIAIGFFGFNAPTASAQISQLISGLLGSLNGSNANTSCGKSSSSGGLLSIFGAGGNSGESFDEASLGGNTANTNDGDLDHLINGEPKPGATTISGTSIFDMGSTTDPSNYPGVRTGQSTSLGDFFSGNGQSSNTSIPGLFGGDPLVDGQVDGGSEDSALSDLMGSYSGSSNSVPIKSDKIEKNTQKTAVETAATTKKLVCTNAVEKAAAQTLLKQLTTSTINWVNHGFKGGGPLFLADAQSFFKTMQNQIVGQFVSSISSDSKNYPFGRDVAQNIVRGLESNFQEKMQYSLDSIISDSNPGMDNSDFQEDFSNGGWSAFEAQFNVNNNPIGFQLASNDKLAQDLKDTQYSQAQDVKDQRLANGGLLDLKKCVSPANFDSDTSNPADCQKWETQTPGSAVSSSLNEATAAPFKQLESGQDLNAGLTAIFNSMLNQLLQKGLSSLSTPDGVSSSYSNNESYASNVSISGGNTLGTNFLSAGNAYQTNIFNLDPSGLDPSDPTGKRVNLIGLIKREMQLVPNDQATADQMAEKFGWTPAQKQIWIKTVTAVDPNYRNLLGRQSNLTERMIPAIFQLDYCIPGPHPDWQTGASNALQRILSDSHKIPRNVDTIDMTDSGDWIKDIPIVGGLINDIIGTVNSENKDAHNESVYGGIVGRFLGVTVAANVKVNGYNTVGKIMNTIFGRYTKAINYVYTPYNLSDTVSPALVNDNKTEWANLPTYVQGIHANDASINETYTAIDQLIRLGAKVYDLQQMTPKADTIRITPPVSGSTGAQSINDSTAATATLYVPGGPLSFDYYQAELAKIATVKDSSQLTDYQRMIKRVSDTFNLLAPGLVSDSDVTAEETTLDNISNKLQNLAGKGGDIEECVKEVKGNPTGPTARMPYPASLSGYLTGSLVENLPTTPSFLPDFYYGQGQAPRELDIFAQTHGFRQDPNKTIQNDDVVTIDKQTIPGALGGLEVLLGIY